MLSKNANPIMTTVFIGGSRKISRLNAEVERRIQAIVEQGFPIVIGDANGADKAVQRYLAKKQYANVTVFCMDGDYRNNMANWPTQAIAAQSSTSCFAYYMTTDRAMASASSYGLMLWDAESKGTLNNVVQLVRQQKPTVVYIAPLNIFETIRTAADVTNLLLAKCEVSSAQRLSRELDLPDAPETPTTSNTADQSPH